MPDRGQRGQQGRISHQHDAGALGALFGPVRNASRAPFCDADAKARTLQILRGHLMLDDREGVVTALRIAAKL